SLQTEIFSLRGDLWRGIGSNGAKLSLDSGDTIFAYIYLDPENIPHEFMLSFVVNGNGEHRAYWGANIENNHGQDGNANLCSMGPLPEAGKWVRLEIPAISIGVPDHASVIDIL